MSHHHHKKDDPPPWNLYCRCGAIVVTSSNSARANFHWCDTCEAKANLICGIIALELIKGHHDIGFTVARLTFDSNWRFDRSESTERAPRARKAIAEIEGDEDSLDGIIP